MTEHDELGQGEIRRGFERIEKQLDAMQLDVKNRYHELTNKMTTALGPVSELRFRCDQHDKDIDEVAGKLRGMERAQNLMELRAAAIGGGATAIFFLVKFLLGK